jgi:hypothetical protein
MEETTLHGGENMLAWLLTWSQTKQILFAHYEKSLLDKPNRTSEYRDEQARRIGEVK